MRRFRGGLIALYNYLKEDCSQVGVGLFSQVKNDGTGGNGLRLCQGRFRLGIRKYFFSEGAGQALEQAPQGRTPSLEAFKKIVDVAVREMV